MSWKKMRKILVLHDAVRIQYVPDKQGNVVMSLIDMRKRQLAGAPVETKYEGTVYLNPRENAMYIWPLKMGGDLHRIYMNIISDIIQPDSKIVSPSGVVPMRPHTDPRRTH